MRGPVPRYPIELEAEQKISLSKISRSTTAAQAEVMRAGILVTAAEQPAYSIQQIAKEVGCAVSTVRKWRKRWWTTKKLSDAPGSGAPRRFSPEVRAQATAPACRLPAEQGLPPARPSSDSLARQLSESGLVKSMAAATVRRWLRAAEIRPRRFRRWLPILEPKAFLKRAEPLLKLQEHAQELLKRGLRVVCLAEKTSIQARKAELGCKAPLPAKLGPPDPRYKRPGAVQLFAGLSVADGKVFGQCPQPNRFGDFQKFIQEQLLPQAVRRKVKRLSLMLDNGPTHAPKQLEKWLASQLKQPELSLSVKVQWRPVRAGWPAQIEIWFNKLQPKVLRSADFETLPALTGAIEQFRGYHNQAAKPIKWTYTAAKLERKLTPKLAANL